VEESDKEFEKRWTEAFNASSFYNVGLGGQTGNTLNCKQTPNTFNVQYVTGLDDTQKK